MSKTIPIQDWLQNIDDEYLSAFIREGGASIKFAVTPDGLKPDLYDAVNIRCQQLDYIFARLDAAETRAHMPQDLFFGFCSSSRLAALGPSTDPAAGCRKEL